LSRAAARERALAMIEKGQEIKAVPPAPRRTGQVVDIFAALKKSLETAGQQKSQTADRGKRKRKVRASIYFPESLPAFFAAVWANK
jgi:non-homologous end joining protein Ku